MLAHASGVKLPAVPRAPGASPAPAGASPAGAHTGSHGGGLDATLGIVALALLATIGVAFAVRTIFHRRGGLRPRSVSDSGRERPPTAGGSRSPAALVLLVGLAAAVVIVARSNTPAESQTNALATNPYLDPGTPVSGPAPDFTLSDQFGRPVSLHSFRGRW